MLLQENGAFHFREHNVVLKYAMVQLIMDWKQISSTASILYDYKFVMLLITIIIGQNNFFAKNFDSKKMEFIKRTIKNNVKKEIDQNTYSHYSHLFRCIPSTNWK